MTKSIFVAGTSTDIGKTFVTALIVKYLRDKSINAGYYKPVLSGAEIVDNKLVPGDAKYVCDIAGINVQPQDLVSYTFKTAVSPHLAAELENKFIDLNKIKTDFTNLKNKYDFVVVEGCGGIVCQIQTPEDWKIRRLEDYQRHNDEKKEIFLTDIIKKLELDVVLVVSSKLGTINSTVLTVEYAKKLNINIKGIIMNYYDKNNFMHIDNKKQIEYLTGIPVIATVAENGTGLDGWNNRNIFFRSIYDFKKI